MSAAAVLRGMARNNLWSNDRLLRACAELDAAELAAPRVSFFPSLLLTLDHIRRVDAYYLGELEQTGRGLAAFEGDASPLPFPELAAAQARSDRALVRLCDALDDAALARRVRLHRGDEGVFAEEIGAVLTHLFVHQIHHRGQVHAMLAGTRVAPPQLDEFFLAYDAARRAGELARLGL
jgi:uncharacterized damage-inducible protein DinB